MLAEETTLVEPEQKERWRKGLVKEMRRLGLLSKNHKLFRTVPIEDALNAALRSHDVVVVMETKSAKQKIFVEKPCIAYSQHGLTLRFVSKDQDKIDKIASYIIESHSN